MPDGRENQMFRNALTAYANRKQGGQRRTLTVAEELFHTDYHSRLGQIADGLQEVIQNEDGSFPDLIGMDRPVTS